MYWKQEKDNPNLFLPGLEKSEWNRFDGKFFFTIKVEKVKELTEEEAKRQTYTKLSESIRETVLNDIFKLIAISGISDQETYYSRTYFVYTTKKNYEVLDPDGIDTWYAFDEFTLRLMYKN